MPRGDGTGPLGFGPMTGRAAGRCAGYPIPGFMNLYGGRRFYGSGRGGGFGRRFAWAAQVVPVYPGYGLPGTYRYESAAPAAAPVDRAVEIGELRAQAEFLKQSLTEISKRIEELEETKHESAE